MEEGTFKFQSDLFLERDLDEIMNGNLDDIIKWLTHIRDTHQLTNTTIFVEVDTGYCNANLKFLKKRFVKE